MNKLALLFFVIAACSGSGSDSNSDGFEPQLPKLEPLQSSIDRAQFDTSTSMPANPAPAVTASVTFDAAVKVYADVLALPELDPRGVKEFCPQSYGVTYQVVFYGAGAELVTAAMMPAGCQFVTLTSKTSSALLATNPDFWSQLSTDLGITKVQIFPYQPPNR
jgi:hypothetical protein